MDIDGPEFINEVNNQIAAIRSTASTAAHDYMPEPFMQVAVLDTNFLISNLAYLRTLTSQAAKYHGSLVLVIPWIVVKELDGLKGMNHQQVTRGDLGDLARKAMKFIESALREKKPWLRGQKSYEIHDENAKLSKGDDSILDCCLFFHNRMGKRVTLLTNDRNLAIQAMIHDIRSLSAENKVHLADFTQSLSKGQVAARHETMESLGMDVDPGQVAPRYVDPTSQYVVSGGPVIDEDVYMDVDDGELVAPAVQTSTPSLHNNNRKSSTDDSIYASRYAHDFGPVNYIGKKQHQPPPQQQYHTRYSNGSLGSTPLPRDKYGEELKPPSSSAGHLDEQRRSQQHKQHAQYNHAKYPRDDTIWSSAYAPR
ncbi:hypothetical protein K492DRAFT_155642 [Lichtheimia hyalospora FSU 10163]|nr:hypothetical protein K492DRAFT_155642 [Lichtheimia hyalospora FSU 10163]